MINHQTFTKTWLLKVNLFQCSVTTYKSNIFRNLSQSILRLAYSIRTRMSWFILNLEYSWTYINSRIFEISKSENFATLKYTWVGQWVGKVVFLIYKAIGGLIQIAIQTFSPFDLFKFWSDKQILRTYSCTILWHTMVWSSFMNTLNRT